MKVAGQIWKATNWNGVGETRKEERRRSLFLVLDIFISSLNFWYFF